MKSFPGKIFRQHAAARYASPVLIAASRCTLLLPRYLPSRCLYSALSIFASPSQRCPEACPPPRTMAYHHARFVRGCCCCCDKRHRWLPDALSAGRPGQKAQTLYASPAFRHAAAARSMFLQRKQAFTRRIRHEAFALPRAAAISPRAAALLRGGARGAFLYAARCARPA